MSAVPSNILTQQAGADPNFNPVFHLLFLCLTIYAKTPFLIPYLPENDNNIKNIIKRF